MARQGLTGLSATDSLSEEAKLLKHAKRLASMVLMLLENPVRREMMKLTEDTAGVASLMFKVEDIAAGDAWASFVSDYGMGDDGLDTPPFLRKQAEALLAEYQHKRKRENGERHTKPA